MPPLLLVLIQTRAALACDAHLASVCEKLHADVGRLARLGIQHHHVRDVNRCLLLPVAPARVLLGGALCLADDVDVLDKDAVLVMKDAQDLARLSLVLAGDDLDAVSGADAAGPGHHSTSGASETMRMKRLSRSSRATGPKTRVPRGSFCALRMTAAFVSKRMEDPSLRL